MSGSKDSMEYAAIMAARLQSLLFEWLSVRLQAAEVAWLREQTGERGADSRSVLKSFTLVSRKIPKGSLSLSEGERESAERALPGWEPDGWELQEAARATLLLSAPTMPRASYLKLCQDLFSCASLSEATALYKSLSLTRYPAEMLEHAQEGLRSNITEIFEAVALRNPYPETFFDENTWNHMILKALAQGIPLNKIRGICRRKNRSLTRMLEDLIRERKAAGRELPAEIEICLDTPPTSKGQEKS
ncbi:MAG: EboA domain-containing protein [Planctomycetes bacterium]|nr:EboA domain-containing protein [Planctomycetota bacterium]